jgi:RNA polymerase sigma factor (sigma-70 family)
VAALLSASDQPSRDNAWAAFLGEYTKLLIHTARRAATDHDEAMEHYTFILDRLREDNCRRLRTFSEDGTGKFTTWLVVVARRLCVDNRRRLHGRPQQTKSDEQETPEQVARRNLADLLAGELDADSMPDERSPAPDQGVLNDEQRQILMEAIGHLEIPDQLLLTLRVVDGFLPEKIARMLNLPTRFHVYRRLKTVLATLRRSLEAKGMTEP